MQLFFTFESIAQQVNGKELNGNIESILKNGVDKITINPTGSEYYDSLLEEYAGHIVAIKPFDYKKINNYLDFINRNMSPYYVQLRFVCNNKKKLSNGDKSCTGVISLTEKKIAGNIRVQTDWKKKGKTKSASDSISKAYLLGNHISFKYKDLGLENSALLFKVKDGGRSTKNYKYILKYTKSFQVQPTAVINASIEHNNIDYLAEIHELDVLNNLSNVEYDVYYNEYDYKASNLLLDLRYKILHDNSVEYSLGYVSRYSKYSHINNRGAYNILDKIGKHKNYHINHIYFITKILNLGLTFYAGYEYDFHDKNKHLTGAIFYEKTLYDYFIDISLLHSNRKWENKEGNYLIDHHKVADSYIATKVGKKIRITNDIIQSVSPYVTLLYDYKLRKKVNKIIKDKKKEKSLQKGIGVAIIPAQKN